MNVVKGCIGSSIARVGKQGIAGGYPQSAERKVRLVISTHDQELMLNQKQAITILENTTNLLPQYPNTDREVIANGVWACAYPLYQLLTLEERWSSIPWHRQYRSQ